MHRVFLSFLLLSLVILLSGCAAEEVSSLSLVEVFHRNSLNKSHENTKKKDNSNNKSNKKVKVINDAGKLDDAEDDEASDDDKAGLEVEEEEPENVEPELIFTSRYLPEFIVKGNTTAEDYFDYFFSAEKNGDGMCEEEPVTSFANVSNHAICGPSLKKDKAKVKAGKTTASRKNLIYLFELNWLPRVTRICSFRMGSDFRNGGAILKDDHAIVSRPNEDLYWGGKWTSDKVLSARQLFFSPDQEHQVMFVGISKCCDREMTMQFDCGEGWEDVTVESVKKWQMKGWRTDHLYLSLNRGHGETLHSVVETGMVNFGDQQEGWYMWEAGTGESHFERPIRFGTWFPFTPNVEVFIRRIDASEDYDTRVYARVNRITSEGFVLDIATTNSSALYQAGVSWIAYTPDALRGTRSSRDCYIGQEGVDNWALNLGKGKRDFTITKRFETPLARRVHESIMGVNLLDASKENLSFDTQLTGLDKKSYDIEVVADHGSKIKALRTCLLAFVPAKRDMESGELLLKHETAPSWYLDEGEGLREFRMWVKFHTRFDDRPDILLTVTGIDLEGATRFDAQVSRVHDHGFEIRVATWGDTEIHQMRVRWLATAAGRRYTLNGHETDSSHKCTCVDAEQEKAQNLLIKTGKITAKTCDCMEDQHGDRSAVYQNFEEGFGGALEFMKGGPKQKPIFYAMKRRTKGNKDVIPMYVYVNSKHEDRLYTTKYFKPNRLWRGGSVAMYVLRRRVPGSVPLYRFFDPVRKRHRYTISTEFLEKQRKLWIMKKGKKLRKVGAFKYEGIQAYVFPVSV